MTYEGLDIFFADTTNMAPDQVISILPDLEDDTEFQEGEEMELPLLPLRNMVMFPKVVIPITVGREKSIRLVKKAYKENKLIGVVAQQDSKHDDPAVTDLHQVGTVAKILKMLVLPDGNTTVVIQGKAKFKILSPAAEDPYLSAHVAIHIDQESEEDTWEKTALTQSLKEAAQKIVKLNKELPQDAKFAFENMEDLTFLTNFLAVNIAAEVVDKQKLLEINMVNERATSLLELMFKEIQLLQLKNEIASKANFDIDQQQRDFFLRQQMKVLQTELGMDTSEQELDALKLRAQEKAWPEEAKKQFEKELHKLTRLNPQSGEYPVLFNYLEFLLDLPWGHTSLDNFDLQRAQKILDKEHYGLEKVKQRIIEYLAVLKLKNNLRGPILCLYGPPGVGKTSLGRSIATALGRQYVRMSLGGLKDESEVRGHRKTYIGAMPGKILQNVKKAGVSNPLFVLDEIDKIGAEFRGDPSSAFLEVLDPEQNESFVDNYLEIEYDLSKVLFIATANSLDTIQPALRDRMEIIELSGYTTEEKVEIAKQHLLPRQKTEHGLPSKAFSIDGKAMRYIIESYTRESGVRSLERKLAAIARYVAKNVAMDQAYKTRIGKAEIEQILGAPFFDKEVYEDNTYAGVVTGLAWTSVGGEILTIESSLSPGKSHVILSGQLGDVMKESATTALSYLKAHAGVYHIPQQLFEKYDLHIHVPAGAVPKDGPSAGITMLTSMASVYTQRKIRPFLAMTGEMTLTGRVLPVGGIKEKLLAAKRAGIKHILMSVLNKKDVQEIEPRYLDGLEILYVKSAAEVLDYALLDELVPNPLAFDQQVQ